MDSVKTPVNILPPMLLRCTSLFRSGLSAYKITSRIIENNKKVGIPTEDNPDGQPNLINTFTYNVVKEICDAIKNDASVQVTIPANSLLIQANGGNAGGPVICTGTNLLDSIGNGIMQ
jgi:hypothetical protein